MPLYIRDERVHDLAQQASSLCGGITKTDAVRMGLELLIQKTRGQESLGGRIAPIQERAAAAGVKPLSGDG